MATRSTSAATAASASSPDALISMMLSRAARRAIALATLYGLIAHWVLAGVDVEAMVVELALLGKGVMGLMEALFMLLYNRARRQSLMYCHIQTKRVERA